MRRHIRARTLSNGLCTQETRCGGLATVGDIWPKDAAAAVSGSWREVCPECARRVREQIIGIL